MLLYAATLRIHKEVWKTLEKITKDEVKATINSKQRIGRGRYVLHVYIVYTIKTEESKDDP